MSLEAAVDLFQRSYGRGPAVVASAPGRVNIIGEHTDYNGGEVLPIAISQRTTVAMAPAAGATSRFVSSERPEVGTAGPDDRAASGHWWDYVVGSLLQVRGIGRDLPAIDVAVASDVPVGAGLSSSAALEVSTVAAALAIGAGNVVDPSEVASLAFRAEREFVGVACGIMDQVASACARTGCAVRIWCDTGRVAHVPFPGPVLVVDTAVPRALRGSPFNARQATCQAALDHLRRHDPGLSHLAAASLEQVEALDGEERRRARHVVTETARVARVVEALAAGQPLGSVLRASHASLRDDYECSCAELDWVVDFAQGVPGVDGARLTGAGWGGCAIVLGDDEGLSRVAETMPKAYASRWGFAPRVWRTTAGHGVMIH